MFTERKIEQQIWQGRWPVIAIVVVMILAAIQILRVNRPVEITAEEETPTIKYTNGGPLVTGSLWIDPNAFHSVRVDLNRKAKIAGTFTTQNSKQRVSVLVLDESNFEKWKSQIEFVPIVATGPVPRGRVSPVVGPGTFFLVIDNRANDNKQYLEADFTLD
ncbi:MAG TPA: hypothetical protein VJV05_05885 [Pyrinomonadaceae bacterium]|nr:hypothetical protein [Pyrinomonadaceae bacterium]